MSGIYGIVRFDGGAASGDWMERMRAAMAYYGPDGGGVRMDGPVGLGHLLRELNPEDSFERQPAMVGRGMVVSAARLDNREELLDALGVAAAEAARLADGALVAMAFDRWGEDVCTHLKGDWALAAWDARERRLLLARDACGNATLYYYRGEGYFAFASSMKALLALPEVNKRPDRLWMAELLTAWQGDAELTAYEGFRRMVWAQAMTVDAEGRTRSWKYWSAEGREPLWLRRDEEYEEAFLELYTRAVKSCLRTRKPVAATLSGGRDSGSVVRLAAPLLAAEGRELTAYTSVPWLAPDGAGERMMGDEWELASATAEMSGKNVRHVPLDAAGYGVLEGIEFVMEAHDGPGHAASNHFWLWAIGERLVEDGAAAMLSGALGNAGVSWEGNGSALLALRRGQPGTALRLLMHADRGIWMAVRHQVLGPLAIPARRAMRRRGRHERTWRTYSALNPQIAGEMNIDQRMREAGFDTTLTFGALLDRQLLFFHPRFGVGASVWSELGARQGYTPLDPTTNQELLEFVLRVPDDQFRRRGEKSWLYQRAFRGRMPEAVLERRKRGLQAADVGWRILRERERFEECLASLESSAGAREMLNLPLMRRTFEQLIARVDPETTSKAGTILLRGMGVGIFLRSVESRRS